MCSQQPAMPRVDAHTHIFCWGEDPEQGFLSRQTQTRWLTRFVRFVTRIDAEAGETLSQKLRNRLLRQLDASDLDYAVVLAQDAVYREDGARDFAATHFYVSNDYVLDLARQSPKVIPGCSINPIRKDAIQELERCFAAGCRLVKIHTAIQGVDPDRSEFEPFYERARELNVVLVFHTGYEHSCRVVSQSYTDPRKLARVLDQGVQVVAAHCGTCAFFDREDYYPRFVEMMGRYDNLYGDTAVMASVIRWFSLRKLSREPFPLRQRIIHGSDYPFPPSRLPHLARVGLWPAERRNPIDMDLKIKRAYDFHPAYSSRILQLIGMGSTSDSTASTETDE